MSGAAGPMPGMVPASYASILEGALEGYPVVVVPIEPARVRALAAMPHAYMLLADETVRVGFLIGLMSVAHGDGIAEAEVE